MSFCKSWFRAKKRPTEIWTEDQAREAHAAKVPYTVLIGSAEAPQCFIEIAGNFVGVGFLDDALRESLTYQFQEIEPGRLFLTTATYRKFAEPSDKVAMGETYFFSRDGAVKIQREFFDPHRAEIAESSVDVSKHYAPFPEFGRYEELIRVER